LTAADAAVLADALVVVLALMAGRTPFGAEVLAVRTTEFTLTLAKTGGVVTGSLIFVGTAV
jgi:hypothetical protein